MPETLKKFFWKLSGFEIGSGVEIGRDVVLNCKNVWVGNHAKISSGFRALGPNNLRIGEFTVFSQDCIVNGRASVDIGKNCFIGHGTIINGYADVKIGDNVALAGAYVQIWTHSTWMEEIEGYDLRNIVAPVEIGDNCYIGAGTILLPGTSIGEGSAIGAGGIVSKNIPANVIAVGVPAKSIKKITKQKKTEKVVKELITKFLGTQNIDCFSFHPDSSGKVVFTWGETPITDGSVFDLKNKTHTIKNKEGIRVRKVLNWYIARF